MDNGADISLHDNEGLTAVSITVLLQVCSYTSFSTSLFSLFWCYLFSVLHAVQITNCLFVLCAVALAGLQWSYRATGQHSTERRVRGCGG